MLIITQVSVLALSQNIGHGKAVDEINSSLQFIRSVSDDSKR